MAPKPESISVSLLELILAVDGWRLERAPAQGLPAAASCRAVQGRRQLVFFRARGRRSRLTAALRAIQRRDRGRFQTVGVVVADTSEELERLRSRDPARHHPRALFTSLPELHEVADLLAPAAAAAIAGPVRQRTFTAPATADPGRIRSFRAEILANTPVGGADGLHYRLVFRAPALRAIQPPQFVMMDTSAALVPLGARAVRRRSLRGALDLDPQPLLKRPFGICRAYYPGFDRHYLRHLRLPATLALALHLAYPDHFDMLYKVLPGGIGTARMTALQRRQRVHMLGPLGRAFDVRRLRADGVDEVHVIGGGVGIAPLILLVETLRQHGFIVKTFLGVATMPSLRYRDELAATFGETPRSAYVYVDDLLAAGLAPADIFISCDREPPRPIGRGLPAANLAHGLVPDQYRRFLEADAARRDRIRQGKIIAFGCGPNRMMEVMTELARAHELPLKLLLEKRMGCGIGVCFSCVCKVRRADGSADYARVCTDGPIFDGKDILWNNHDLQSALAGSGSAARC